MVKESMKARKKKRQNINKLRNGERKGKKTRENSERNRGETGEGATQSLVSSLYYRHLCFKWSPDVPGDPQDVSRRQVELNSQASCLVKW